MRAYAVFLVVVDHLSLAQHVQVIAHRSTAWLGVAGVYIFFVHTSLVLMWSLERRPHPLDFYIRRAFRIYPLAMLAVALTVALHAPVGGSPSNYFAYRSPAGMHGFLYNLLLLQDVFHYPRVLGVLWSLPLEAGMYIFLPALFFLLRKSRSIWPLLFLWLACVLLAAGLTSNGNTFPTVIPCFLPGVMAYALFRRVNPFLPAWLFPPFLLVMTAMFLQDPKVERSWPFCFVLGVCLPLFHQISWTLLRRLNHEIAKYSYGIYLCHPFAIVIGFYILDNSSMLTKLVTALSSLVVLSIAAYHLVERPMIDLGYRIAATMEKRFEVQTAS